MTQAVTFKATLQKGNRIQIPRLIRWQYKLEPQQVLKVNVTTSQSIAWEEFHVCMTSDGRVVIPKLILRLLQGDDDSLVRQIFRIQLEPVEERQAARA